MNAEDLKTNLAYYTGSENLYFNPMYKAMKYTDGVKYLAENAGAYWLLDIIGTEVFPKQASGEYDYFVTVKISVQDNEALIRIEDGNDNLYATKRIEFTDFPGGEWALWLVDGVLILPSEY